MKNYLYIKKLAVDIIVSLSASRTKISW